MIIIHWYSENRNRWFKNTYTEKDYDFQYRVNFLTLNKVAFKIEET